MEASPWSSQWCNNQGSRCHSSWWQSCAWPLPVPSNRVSHVWTCSYTLQGRHLGRKVSSMLQSPRVWPCPLCQWAGWHTSSPCERCPTRASTGDPSRSDRCSSSQDSDWSGNSQTFSWCAWWIHQVPTQGRSQFCHCQSLLRRCT